MLNLSNVQLIKPKTLQEDKFAYLIRDACRLDFGSSSVLMPKDSQMNFGHLVLIPIKDLFNQDASKLLQIAKGSEEFLSVPKLDWKEIPINLLDTGAFNAPASAGEDLFWAGELIVSKNKLRIHVAGLVYYIEHEMPKITEGIETAQVIPLDYNAFYYLNQLFKKVTKTKPKNLKFAFKNDVAYLTNSDEEFFILVPTKYSKTAYKTKVLEEISNTYRNTAYTERNKELVRKDYVKDQDSLLKHLSKVLDDKFSFSESVYIQMFSSGQSKLYLNKRKEK